MKRISAIGILIFIFFPGCQSSPMGDVIRVEEHDGLVQFAGSQGMDNWYYQYYDGSDWQYMLYNKSLEYWEYKGTTWARVAKDYQHPGFDGTRTARVWESPYGDNTTLDIHLELEKKEMGGDGVNFSIMVENEIVYGPLLLESLDVIPIDIQTRIDWGERVYFILDYVGAPNFDWLWFRSASIKAYLTEEPPAPKVSEEEFVESPELDQIDFSFELSRKSIVPNTARVPIYPWFPDGHISYLKEEDGENFQMYWSGSSTYRTVGPDLAGMILEPNEPVLTRDDDRKGIDNGGAWLMNVFRIEGPELLGYYHAEDHYWDGLDNPGGVAYKSIHVAYSHDNGLTWEKGGEIIRTRNGKPDSMAWSGSGDFSVVLNSEEERYYLYYSENNMIHLAVSDDPLGAPGTWKKYTWAEPFTEEGLGGLSNPLWGISEVPGANPSIHWNEYLEKWIMVWHGWDPPGSYISASDNLVDWTMPTVLVPSEFDSRNWYPNLIGSVSDQYGGQSMMLYYSNWPSKYYWTNRKFIAQELIFHKSE